VGVLKGLAFTLRVDGVCSVVVGTAEFVNLIVISCSELFLVLFFDALELMGDDGCETASIVVVVVVIDVVDIINLVQHADMLDVVVVVVVKATSRFEEGVLVVVLGEDDFLLTRLEELAEIVEVSFDVVVVGDGRFEETDLCCIFSERGLGIVDLGLEVSEEGMIRGAAGRASWREGEIIILWLCRGQGKKTRQGKKKTDDVSNKDLVHVCHGSVERVEL